MIRSIPGAMIAAALALLAPALGASAAAAPAGSPLAVNGKVSVCGTTLCNEHGNPIQLRGMSTHGTQWYAQCVNDKSLDALAEDWRADILRVSTYVQEGGYETDPAKFTRIVNRIVEEATERGLYVIVDWHLLDPGDPFFNLARAKTFFKNVARRHREKVNVLYEVANEPNGVSWNRLKDYHETIIPIIRRQDADGVVLLGTRAWASLGVSEGADETEVIDNPVDAENIMYTFHFYAASHGAVHLDALARAADQVPMFVTEFGTQSFTGDGANDFVQSQKYIDLMKRKKISWTSWNYSDDQRSGAAFKPGTCPDGRFAGTKRLKEAGKWVRARIRTADDFPTD